MIWCTICPRLFFVEDLYMTAPGNDAFLSLIK